MNTLWVHFFLGQIQVTPGKMVTHNGSNLFRELMATVIADALGEHTFEFVAELLCDKEGVKVLTETLQVHDPLQDTYWICALSVNQHAGANPDGDTDPVTKIPHPVCGCKTVFFSTKTLHWMNRVRAIMCEMNKFDDMMALLAKKNPNFTEVVAVDADLNLFRILVVAMLRWMGPWQRFHKATPKGWAKAIETAIWGYSTPPGRCGYLFWTAIAGLRCHLEWMCSLQWSHHVLVETPGESFSWKMYSDARLAASDWHFQFTQLENCAEWCLPNSFGQIRVGWISDSALAKLVRLSWTRVLFQSDTKTLKHLPDHLNPYFGFHNAVIKECGERYKMTVQIAAASDGRILERMGAPEVCACGINSPDREHPTFHCHADTAEKPVLKTHMKLGCCSR